MTTTQADVMRSLDHLTTAVAMVTVGTKEKRNAMTATRVACISGKPPLVAVAIGPNRFSHDLIKEAREFVVNLAAADQAELATNIGKTSGRDIDKFAEFNIATMPGTEVQSPLIDGSAAVMECKLVNAVEIGDRTLFVGEVVALHVDAEKAPLARFRNKYRNLGDQI